MSALDKIRVTPWPSPETVRRKLLDSARRLREVAKGPGWSRVVPDAVRAQELQLSQLLVSCAEHLEAQAASVADGKAPEPERRAPVQGDYQPRGRPPGTITWTEHEEAWRAYAKRYGTRQDAERIAERGGFGFGELTELLGREPTTWEASRG